MKKAAAISLLFLFLFTNSGIAVNVHWCRGKITSVKFFENDKYGCKCGKKAMKRGCCKDKSVILKAPLDPAKTNQFSFNIQIPKLEVAHVEFTEIVPLSQLEYFSSRFYRPPPFKPKTPIYLFDGVFRI